MVLKCPLSVEGRKDKSKTVLSWKVSTLSEPSMLSQSLFSGDGLKCKEKINLLLCLEAR